jgi:hypothetical protein
MASYNGGVDDRAVLDIPAFCVDCINDKKQSLLP